MAQIRNGTTGNVYLHKGIFIARNFTHKMTYLYPKVDALHTRPKE